jgi:hypothetical protein
MDTLSNVFLLISFYMGKICSHFLGCFLLYVLLKALLSFVLASILSFRLLKRFDPPFAESLWYYYGAAPFSTRLGRTTTYAMWVAKKEWFARDRPDVLAFDTRESFSRTTIGLCWVSTVFVLLYLVDIAGIAVFRLLGWF